MKRTYLVTLADRDTGKDQRILVYANHPDNMQAFVERADLKPPLQIGHPVVISVKELAIKRPLPKTTMASFTA